MEFVSARSLRAHVKTHGTAAVVDNDNDNFSDLENETVKSETVTMRSPSTAVDLTE